MSAYNTPDSSQSLSRKRCFNTHACGYNFVSDIPPDIIQECFYNRVEDGSYKCLLCPAGNATCISFWF
jgi:hypothetical protein